MSDQQTDAEQAATLSHDFESEDTLATSGPRALGEEFDNRRFAIIRNVHQGWLSEGALADRVRHSKYLVRCTEGASADFCVYMGTEDMASKSWLEKLDFMKQDQNPHYIPIDVKVRTAGVAHQKSGPYQGWYARDGHVKPKEIREAQAVVFPIWTDQGTSMAAVLPIYQTLLNSVSAARDLNLNSLINARHTPYLYSYTQLDEVFEELVLSARDPSHTFTFRQTGIQVPGWHLNGVTGIEITKTAEQARGGMLDPAIYRAHEREVNFIRAAMRDAELDLLHDMSLVQPLGADIWIEDILLELKEDMLRFVIGDDGEQEVHLSARFPFGRREFLVNNVFNVFRDWDYAFYFTKQPCPVGYLLPASFIDPDRMPLDDWMIFQEAELDEYRIDMSRRGWFRDLWDRILIEKHPVRKSVGKQPNFSPLTLASLNMMELMPGSGASAKGESKAGISESSTQEEVYVWGPWRLIHTLNGVCAETRHGALIPVDPKNSLISHIYFTTRWSAKDFTRFQMSRQLPLSLNTPTAPSNFRGLAVRVISVGMRIAMGYREAFNFQITAFHVTRPTIFIVELPWTELNADRPCLLLASEFLLWEPLHADLLQVHQGTIGNTGSNNLQVYYKHDLMSSKIPACQVPTALTKLMQSHNKGTAVIRFGEDESLAHQEQREHYELHHDYRITVKEALQHSVYQFNDFQENNTLRSRPEVRYCPGGPRFPQVLDTINRSFPNIQELDGLTPQAAMERLNAHMRAEYMPMSEAEAIMSLLILPEIAPARFGGVHIMERNGVFRTPETLGQRQPHKHFYDKGGSNRQGRKYNSKSTEALRKKKESGAKRKALRDLATGTKVPGSEQARQGGSGKEKSRKTMKDSYHEDATKQENLDRSGARDGNEEREASDFSEESSASGWSDVRDDEESDQEVRDARDKKDKEDKEDDEEGGENESPMEKDGKEQEQEQVQAQKQQQETRVQKDRKSTRRNKRP